MQTTISTGFGRRTLLKADRRAGLLAAPPIIAARGEAPVKIGMVDPLTGILSALAASEVEGAKYAVANVNKKNGILGRQVELLVEDSANDVGTGVQKTHKLIDRDKVDVIFGDVNSGIAYAMSQVTSETEGVPHRAGRPHRPDHRHRLQVERLPHLQHNVDGRRGGHRRPGQAVRQEVVLHHPGLCLRPHAAGQLHQEPEGAGRRVSGATCCRSTPRSSPPR